jgi:acyl-coenzyme A thioesterase PaaI-like protein
MNPEDPKYTKDAKPRSPFTSAHLDGEGDAGDRASLSNEAGLAWLRLSGALRRAVGSAVELDANAESLNELATAAERFANEMEIHATGRKVPLFGSGGVLEEGDLGAMMPFSPVLGEFNPASPPLEFRHEDDRVVGRARFGSTSQGAPGLVHGAVISGIYDELLAMANLMEGVPGPTAKLTIRYRKPTPLHTDLRFEAWVDEKQGRRVHARGRCLDGDRVLTEAEGIFIRIDHLES